MDAISRAQDLICRDRGSPDAMVLAHLLSALQQEGPLDLAGLYRLPLDLFELALQVIEDWRLQRYYLRPQLGTHAAH